MLAVYGYPSKFKTVNKKEGVSEMKQFGRTQKGEVKIRKEKEELIFQNPTLPGMSGTPIIKVGSDRKLSIVGIHLGALQYKENGVAKKGNVGRILTRDLVDVLKRESLNIHAEMFRVNSEEENKEEKDLVKG